MKSESKTLHRISPKGEQQRTADHPLPLRSAEAAAQPVRNPSSILPSLLGTSAGSKRKRVCARSLSMAVWQINRPNERPTDRPIADNDEAGKWSFQRANASSDRLRLRLRDMDLVC